MAEYDNTNSGALFKNDRRSNDKQPNLRGSVNVEGVEYWISAWTREVKGGARQGEKMISMALEPKEDRHAPAGQNTTKDKPVDDFDDDIPFS